MGKGRIVAVMATLAAAALAAVLVGCSQPASGGGSSSPTTSKEPIKIGAIVSLTGTYAGLGTPEKNAIDMLVKQVNDAGGINGRPVEVVFADDGTDEAKAVAAATKLIEQDKVVAIIGATGSGQTMAIRSAIDRAGIPNVSMAGATVITSKFDPLVFQTPWSNNIVVPYTLDYLKKAGITKVAVISDSGGFGKDGRAVIASMAPTYGIKVVSDQTFNPGDTDMTAQLTKIKASDAQAILMWTAGKEAAIIAKNRDALGIKIPLYGSHGIARKEFIDGAGASANGVKFAAGKVLIPSSWGAGTAEQKATDAFVAAYKSAYGTDPNTFAGHASDAFNIIVAALKSTNGDTTATKLRDAIEKTTGFAGIGGTFNFSPTDHNGLTKQDLNMYLIKNGQWTLAP